MNPARSEPVALDQALKTLWGASNWPAPPNSQLVLSHQGWEKARNELDQLLSLRLSGVLQGPHGVGKSYLLHHWTQTLCPKRYRLLRLTHASLQGSDLIRNLVRVAGKNPYFRRGDNVQLLADIWREGAPQWPLILIEEAQDLNIPALEEMRLLLCARPDAQPTFSLLLCGDEDLLPKLQLGVNKALISRLAFCVTLDPWPLATLRDYLNERLREVSIATSPLEPGAETLLLQGAQGSPRTLNILLQRSMEQAALDKRRTITAADVQAVIETLPWLIRFTNRPAP